MKKSRDIEELNNELEKSDVGFPWWLLIIVASFFVGFVFRYQIAGLIKPNNEEEDKKQPGQVIVWDEPSTLSEEEKWNESDALTFANRIVKIDGVKYKIPCALYRFIENGWSVDISGNNNHSIVYVATEQMDNFVSLTKGDKEIKIVSAVSPIDTQVMVDESFIGGFTIFSWTNVDVEFAKGLACGMSKEEVDKLLKEEKLDGNMLQKDGDNYQLTLEEKNGSKIKESIYQIKFKEDKVDQIRMEVRYR